MELEHLIAMYRRHGLTDVADVLDVAKDGLVVHGLLPERLEEQPDLPPLAPAPAPSRPIIYMDVDEYVYVQRESSRRLPRDDQYEFDEALGVTARQHNALLDAGFTTLAEVREALGSGLLQYVRNIGKQSLADITQALYLLDVGDEQGLRRMRKQRVFSRPWSPRRSSSRRT